MPQGTEIQFVRQTRPADPAPLLLKNLRSVFWLGFAERTDCAVRGDRVRDAPRISSSVLHAGDSLRRRLEACAVRPGSGTTGRTAPVTNLQKIAVSALPPHCYRTNTNCR